MKRIIFFHYHFLPGGVTSVVRNILGAVKEIEEIILCCDTGMGASGLAPARGLPPFRFYDLPEMGYRTRESYDLTRFQREKREILKALRKMEGPETLFWVHNHHLGKNPAFTAALSEYARNGESPMLLQIHDFPESGRWDNYTFLQEYTEEWYPQGERVYYAVINLRDNRILSESGVPQERLFYLPNTVSPGEGPERDAASRLRAGEAVRGYCLKSGFSFDEKAPLLVYPVRTIRRKNVIEAFLIACITGSNLIVTLPANSDPERPYEAVVSGLSRESFFRGAWGLSRFFPGSFPEVVQAADLVLSSSVMEGFGLFFLETKARESNFVARSLDIMDDFEGLDREGVYDILPVPAVFVDRDALKESYIKRIARLPLPGDFVQDLTERTLYVISKDPVDFAFLDVPQQAAILKERRTREGIRDAGKEIVEKVLGLAGTYRDQGIDLDPFSMCAHEKRVEGLLKKISQGERCGQPLKVKRQAVLRQFLKPDMVRLLLDYKGEKI